MIDPLLLAVIAILVMLLVICSLLVGAADLAMALLFTLFIATSAIVLFSVFTLRTVTPPVFFGAVLATSLGAVIVWIVMKTKVSDFKSA